MVGHSELVEKCNVVNGTVNQGDILMTDISLRNSFTGTDENYKALSTDLVAAGADPRTGKESKVIVVRERGITVGIRALWGYTNGT